MPQLCRLCLLCVTTIVNVNFSARRFRLSQRCICRWWALCGISCVHYYPFFLAFRTRCALCLVFEKHAFVYLPSWCWEQMKLHTDMLIPSRSTSACIINLLYVCVYPTSFYISYNVYVRWATKSLRFRFGIKKTYKYFSIIFPLFKYLKIPFNDGSPLFTHGCM